MLGGVELETGVLLVVEEAVVVDVIEWALVLRGGTRTVGLLEERVEAVMVVVANAACGLVGGRDFLKS